MTPYTQLYQTDLILSLPVAYCAEMEADLLEICDALLAAPLGAVVVRGEAAAAEPICALLRKRSYGHMLVGCWPDEPAGWLWPLAQQCDFLIGPAAAATSDTLYVPVVDSVAALGAVGDALVVVPATVATECAQLPPGCWVWEPDNMLAVAQGRSNAAALRPWRQRRTHGFLLEGAILPQPYTDMAQLIQRIRRFHTQWRRDG